MKLQLILLGSNFLHEHEYELPKFISADSLWTVFSIDYKNCSESRLKFDNIEIFRINRSVKEIDTILNLDILNSDILNSDKIYIMDSISYASVTDASHFLIDYFKKLGKCVYWTHYISPYNIDPTFKNNIYSDEELYLIFGTIFTKQFFSKLSNPRVFHMMKLVFQNANSYFIDGLLNSSILQFDKIQTKKILSKLLTTIDLKYIEFELIQKYL